MEAITKLIEKCKEISHPYGRPFWELIEEAEKESAVIPQQPLCADGALPKLPSDIVDLLKRCRDALYPYYSGTLLIEDLDHILGNFTKR